MFASLKNKIKEETGSEVGPHQRPSNNNRLRSRFSSTMSVNSSGDPTEQHYQPTEGLSALRSQCNELTTKVADLSAHIQTLQEEKSRVEKTNEILLETVKVAQTQKDMYCEEQEKIQNMQQQELDKLKCLLSFREQEAVDRLGAIRQSHQQLENLTTELERLKNLEPMVEDLQDELDRLRHSSQLGKNSFTTTLAAVEEENRTLKIRVQIMEQARLEAITTLSNDEKIQALVQERKLLEQHLEEAHLQLSDIKSSWSCQNLALETQVSRLSNQVAEETTEKRRALKARDDSVEKIKQLEFEVSKMQDEIKQRDDKIQLLEEDLDDLNTALKECREENEQQVVFERNKAETLEQETKQLKTRLQAAEERFSEYAAAAERVEQTLRQQNAQLQEQLSDMHSQLDAEKDDKLTALLRNAEISQSEEILKKELRIERDESNELHEKCVHLQAEVESKEREVTLCNQAVDELKVVVQRNEERLRQVDDMQNEMSDKNKTIKVLNQHLSDLKKTLQNEFRASKSFEAMVYGAPPPGAPLEKTAANGHVPISSKISSGRVCPVPGNVIMDEVNFKYLKHVVIKFLTSREVEARHLIRAVATLLKLTKDEEKLLHDTLNWKMSWFGSKPDPASGQRAFSIRPS